MRNGDMFWLEVALRVFFFVIGAIAAGYLFRIGWEWHG